VTPQILLSVGFRAELLWMQPRRNGEFCAGWYINKLVGHSIFSFGCFSLSHLSLESIVLQNAWY